MAKAARPSVFTLSFGRDLSDETADLVIKTCGDDPLALSDAIIFLPNNRAITAMREAFVRRAAPGLLMPRLVAIGDLALDESLGPLLDPMQNEAQPPALIVPLRRQLLLAEMIAQEYRGKGRDLEPTEAMRLARLMGQLIDELDIEQISLARFQELAGEREISEDPDLAQHWQSSYAVLLAILPRYRAKLQELCLDGPAARRNILLGALTQRLRAGALKQPIFASGISTSAPAIARLLQAVAFLPRGHVILPPVDLAMKDQDWEALGPLQPEEGKPPGPGRETHPQYHLKQLLARMGINRAEIQPINLQNDNAKSKAVAQIFCLPGASTHWSALPENEKEMPGLRFMEAEDNAEEARAIALLTRQALEQPEARVAIATPDRELAVRISRQLKRWNIDVDDSAGTPLLQSAPGTLAMALFEAAAQRFSPVSLLAIAKHPLVHAGDGRLDWLANARALDLELRGPCEGSGLSATAKRLSKAMKEANRPEDISRIKSLQSWWDDFAAALQPIEAAASKGLSPMLDAVIAVLGGLTDMAVWRREAGRQLAARFEQITAENYAPLGRIAREALPTFFAELCQDDVVRAPYGGHPRVKLLGLLEARLQQADLVICAGLNEGSWPQLPAPDPWLAPRIRRQLGLPGLERNLGLSAHDLSVMMGAKQCVVTRARRDRAGPAVSSRFLLRIQAFLGKALEEETQAIAFARAVDRTSPVPFASPPQIRPSREQRQVRISVTNFDLLKADPFAFYARKILRIPPLQGVDTPPDAAWRGTMIHGLLEDWAREDGCAPDKLMARAQSILSNPDWQASMRTLWVPRISEALRWVADETAELFGKGRSLGAAEISGQVVLDGVKVTGRADRIDRTGDGGLIIIDYKTGEPPAAKQIKAGFALQLGLLGHMAEVKAFEGAAGQAQAFEYWSFAKDGDSFGKRYINRGASGEHGTKPEAMAETMLSHARDAIATWINGDAPFEAKLHPEYAPYSDYDQLSRRAEWDGRQSLDQSGDEE